MARENVTVYLPPSPGSVTPHGVTVTGKVRGKYVVLPSGTKIEIRK